MFNRHIIRKNLWNSSIIASIAIAGIPIYIIGEISESNIFSVIGSGLFVSGLISFVVYNCESRASRKMDLEEVYLICSKFYDRCRLIARVGDATRVREETVEAYRILVQDYERLNLIWGRLWFDSQSEHEYYYNNIYQPMSKICNKLQCLFDYHDMKGGPLQAYAAAIVGVQEDLGTYDKLPPMLISMNEALDQLLIRVNRCKC